MLYESFVHLPSFLNLVNYSHIKIFNLKYDQTFLNYGYYYGQIILKECSFRKTKTYSCHYENWWTTSIIYQALRQMREKWAAVWPHEISLVNGVVLYIFFHDEEVMQISNLIAQIYVRPHIALLIVPQ